MLICIYVSMTALGWVKGGGGGFFQKVSNPMLCERSNLLELYKYFSSNNKAIYLFPIIGPR